MKYKHFLKAPLLMPARRGMGAGKQPPADPAKPPPPRHVAMGWAQRLTRVFGIEIARCTCCDGKLKIIARIEEPEVIAKVLSHLQRTALRAVAWATWACKERQRSLLPDVQRLVDRRPPSGNRRGFFV